MTQRNIDRHNEYFRSILDQLPFPLAEALQGFCESTDPATKFRYLIRVGSVYIKSLSIVAIANYNEKKLSDDCVNEVLGSRQFCRPCLGHFIRLLRDILKLFKDMPETFKPHGLINELIKPNGKPKPVMRALEETFLRLRNLYVHPDIEPSRDIAEKLIDKHVDTMKMVVEKLEFITSLELRFRCTQKDDTYFIIRGPDPEKFETGKGTLTDTEQAVVVDGEEQLNLFPFVQSGCPEMSEAGWSIFLFESLLEKYAKYTNAHGLLLSNQTVDLLRGLQKRWNIKKAKQEMARAEKVRESVLGDINWKVLQSYSDEESKKLVDMHRRAQKYHQDLYHHRARTEEQFTEFFDGTDSALFLVASSGSGKTNLLCHITRERLNHGDIVLHLYGRDYTDGAIETLLESKLKIQPEGFDGFFQALGQTPAIEQGRRFIVIIDAINEYRDPQQLFHRIITFAQGRNSPWFKLVVSCRPLAWKQIETTVSWDDVAVYTTQAGCAHVDLTPFSQDEIEEAFDRYRSFRQKKFNIIIEEQFEELSFQVQEMIRHPVLLRFICTTYQRVPKVLIAPKILLKHFDDSISERHHKFINYFIDLLWDLKTDFLTQEKTIALMREGDRAAAKVLEYWFEGRVDYEASMLRCTSCDHTDKYYDPDLMKESRCPECELITLEPVIQKVMNTFDALVDDGVLSESESSPRGLRFMYDRFFEAMMSRKVYGLAQADMNPQAFLVKLLEEEGSRLLFHDALKTVLILMVIGDQETYATEEKHATGKLPDELESLCERVLENGIAHAVNIVENALIDIGGVPQYQPAVEVYLHKLALHDLNKKQSGARLTVALNVASQLGLAGLIALPIEKGNSDARLLGSIQLFRLWRLHPEKAFGFMRDYHDDMFRVGVFPKFRRFEAIAVGSAAIFFDGFADQGTVTELHQIWKKIIKRLKRFRPTMWLMAPMALKYFSKVPQDYNPANAFEYKDNHKYIKKSKPLRALLQEMVKYYDPDYGSMQQFRKLAIQLAEMDKGSVASWSYFLMIAISRYPKHNEEIFDIFLEFSKASDAAGGAGAGLDVMATQWAMLREDFELTSDQYDRIKSAAMKRIMENMGAYKSLKRSYHFPVLLEFMRLVHHHTGSIKVPFLDELVQKFLDNERHEDLMWVARNLEILGIEFGTFSDADRDMALYALMDMLKHDLPKKVRTRCVAIMARYRLFFAPEVGRLLETMTSGEARARLLAEMNQQRPKIHIGELMSAKPFAFWIHVVQTPKLREVWMDLYDYFLRTRFILSWARRVMKQAQQLITSDIEN